jgi:glucose-1-phosphatase
MADKIKAIIFDVGGVLLRTEDYAPRARLAQRLGMTREHLEKLVFDSDSAMAATVGKKTAREHWQTVWQSLNIPEAEWPKGEEVFWGGDTLDVSLIDFIHEQKKVRQTALLSNAWSDLRERLIHEYPCLDAFDCPIFSYEVGLAKPDPAIYRLTLHRLGVKPTQAIFVDDNEANILSAAALGIHAIQFKSAVQTLDQIDLVLKDHNGSYFSHP